MYFDSPHIHVDRLRIPGIPNASLELDMVRFDQLHPLISGNKWYKLIGSLQDHPSTKRIITFGGAWSNHLHATAAFCHEKGLSSIAYVRGEPAETRSATLTDCLEMGMEIRYLNRKEYRQWQQEQQFPIPEASDSDTLIIPEGGSSGSGARGAALMYDAIPSTATHILVAAGTGTTAAGLFRSIQPHQELIVVPVLKGLNDIRDRIEQLSGLPSGKQISFWMDAHEGGYAKLNSGLLAFMNDFYQTQQVPLDFVYTGKMMKAVIHAVKNNYFPPGSHIVTVHSGGLQGNRSLEKGRLTY